MMNNLELKALFHCVAEHQDDQLAFLGIQWDWTTGVCFNLSDLYAADLVSIKQVNRVEELMCEWAGKGYTSYPVPASPDVLHGSNVYSMEDPEIRCFNLLFNNELDMYTGTYGRSRREMCRYIAENLK